jgi:outer membrane receptor protein involved in Fe transport
MWGEAKDSLTPGEFNDNDCFCDLGWAESANTVDTYYYHDLSLGYSKDQWSVKAGVNNAFDKSPPILPQLSNYGNTGTNTSVEAYDTVGAAWYLQFNWSTE